MRIKPLIFLICFLGITTNLISQSYKILNLRGIEDTKGNTQLFYRFDTTYSLKYFSSAVRKYDVVNKTDIEFLSSYFYIPPLSGPRYSYYTDFRFWDGNIKNFMACGISGSDDASLFIERYNNGEGKDTYGNLAFGEIPRVFISKKNDSLVYANMLQYMKISTDSGKTWNDNYDAPFLIISPDEFNEDSLFGHDYDGNLLVSTDSGKTSSTLLEGTQWSEDSKFLYDKDGKHIYAVTRGIYDSRSEFWISDQRGATDSWKRIADSRTRRINITQDDSVSGEVYYSAGNNIYKSVDHGESFSLYKNIDRTITGIYKMSNTDSLFVSTPYFIMKVWQDSSEVIKWIDQTENLKFYPLNIGDKWVYDENGVSYTTEPEYFSSVITREVIKDTLINHKKYFQIKETKVVKGNESVKFYYERIDSAQYKVFVYESGAEDEILRQDLSVVVGDTMFAKDFVHYYQLDEKFLKVENFSIWNLNTKKWNFAVYEIGNDEYDLVKGIGYYWSYDEFDFGNSTLTLKGALINDVLYGDTTITVLNEGNNSIPKKFELSQNYPNPFNPSTKIKYSIPANSNFTGSKVVLKIYNILGREIKTLVNKTQPPGNYEVEFNGNNLPSGVYIYRIKSGSLSLAKKMLLLK